MPVVESTLDGDDGLVVLEHILVVALCPRAGEDVVDCGPYSACACPVGLQLAQEVR